MNTTLSKSARNKPEPGKTNLRNHFLAIFLLSGIMYYLLDSATDEEILDITRLLDLQSQDYDYFMANVDTVHPNVLIAVGWSQIWKQQCSISAAFTRLDAES